MTFCLACMGIPPKCELLVEWDPKRKNKKPVRLRHKIKLIGARKPFNFFTLSLNPTWKDSMLANILSCSLSLFIIHIFNIHTSLL